MKSDYNENNGTPSPEKNKKMFLSFQKIVNSILKKRNLKKIDIKMEQQAL